MQIKVTASIYFFLVVAADQLTKYFALQSEFFKPKIIKNPGFPFIGNTMPGFFILILTCVFLFLFLYLSFRYMKEARIDIIWIIAGGAVSNLIDRGIDGTVIDWIYFFGISTLNLADIAILFGAGYLMFKMVHIRKFIS